MKNILVVLLFVSGVSFGQLSTPSGIKYHKFGTGPDVVVYMDGYSSYPNPLGSAFYKQFYPYIKDKATVYMAIPFPSTGWEKPWNGKLLGTDFLNFVVHEHPTARIFVTGFSAGGDSGYIYGAERVTAFAAVAGSDLNNYNGMMNWRTKGIPVWAFIGTNDTSENSRANCEKTWVVWYYGSDHLGKLKDGTPTYVTGGHSSVPAYAYNPANGLWEWFNSIGKPPDNSGIDKHGLKFYLRHTDGKIVFEFEGGVLKEVTPD